MDQPSHMHMLLGSVCFSNEIVCPVGHYMTSVQFLAMKYTCSMNNDVSRHGIVYFMNIDMSRHGIVYSMNIYMSMTRNGIIRRCRKMTKWNLYCLCDLLVQCMVGLEGL